MTLFECVRQGLNLLQTSITDEMNIQITEAGNDLSIWDYNGKPILVSVNVAGRLDDLGWYVNQEGMWSIPMSK